MKNVRHILNEGFDRLFETKKVIKESAPNAPLTEKQKKIAIELRRTLEDCLHRKDAPTSLKDIEYALQNVIERYFPDNAWWEVADIDIFGELLSNKDNLSDLLFVPIKIAKSIKPEFLGEEKEYGFEDCDDEECEGDECNESSNDDAIGNRVAEYQKWVDYDMKKYGKISGKTMGILKREGFTVVKDEYGDLEVIPEEKNHSSVKESKKGLTKITEGRRSNKRTFRYDVGDNKYSFYCETEDTRYGFRHLCSMFLRGQEVGDSVKKYYNRTWEMFDYQSAMLSAVENSSVSEEDKKSLKEQINEGEGLREGCEGDKCEAIENRSLEDVMDVELEDDSTPYGGTSFYGETVRDFIEEVEGSSEDTDNPIKVDTIDKLNDLLKQCGIKPIKTKLYKKESKECNESNDASIVDELEDAFWELVSEGEKPSKKSVMERASDNNGSLDIKEARKVLNSIWSSLTDKYNDDQVEGGAETINHTNTFESKKCNESNDASIVDELEDAFWELVSEGEKPSKKSVMERASDNNGSLDIKEARKVLNSIWSSLTDKYNDDQVEGGAETINHTNTFESKKCNEEIDKKGEKDIIAWWEDVEKWNSENGSPFNVDNDKSDIEGMHSAMFDMLRELKDKAEDLYKRGKKIYNRYAFSKINESEDDDDISDDEYYAELEAHIKRVPSYDDEKLKAEYEEFKDSTHEDDIRVETALKDEMIKRGFLFVYEGMKVLNENAPNFAVQDGLPIYAFLNYDEEYDNIWDRAKEEYEGEVNDDGWDEFLEDFEEKYFDEYLKGYAVIDPENDEFGEDGKTLNDAIKDFNDMLKGLTNKAYDASEDAWRDYENARDNEDVSDEDVRKLNDKANELDDIYSYLRDLELSIQSGYHQGYQLYLDGWDDIPDDFPQEYTDAIIDAYNKVGKDYHLMKLGLAYQASNGEAGYSLIED